VRSPTARPFRRAREAARSLRADPTAALAERWLAALVAAATLVQASAFARVLPGDQPPPMKDSVIFEVYGWHLLRGRRLYTDLWEVKPPTSFQTTALLAALSGGDPLAYHYLVVAATGAAAVGCAAMVGVLVVEVTGDELAGLVGGLAAMVHPVVFMRAAYGFKSKYFFLLAGLLAVWLVLRERPLAAGVAASAAVGYWQLGVGFPLVVLALGFQRGGRRGAARVTAGGLAFAALTLGPVALRGGFTAMLAEAVVAPVAVGGSFGLRVQVRWLLDLLGPAKWFVALGGAGVLASTVPPSGRRDWWLAAVWAWFGAHVFFVNVDFYADLVPIVVLSGLGVGVLVAWLPRAASVPLRGVVVAALLVSAGTLGGVVAEPHPVVEESPPVADPADVSPPHYPAEKRALLFAGAEPSTCHVFVGKRHRAWFDATPAERWDETCGHLPPAYEWVRSAVPGPLRGIPPENAGAPVETPTPTPTPRWTPTPSPAPPAVVVDGLDYRRADGGYAVEVPLVNREERPRSVTVAVVLETADGEGEASRAVTVSGGERRTVVLRFDLDGPLESLSVDLESESADGGNGSTPTARAPAGPAPATTGAEPLPPAPADGPA